MIAAGKVVTLEYTLKNDAGEVLEESSGNPLNYLHGHQNIVTGLEEALEGLTSGDQKNVIVTPDKGYGSYDEQKIIDVPIENFAQGAPEAGQFIQVSSAEGAFPAQVKAVAETSVTLDANHPMAGQTLHFDIQITDIRDATEEELSHGHVHGAGGCEH